MIKYRSFLNKLSKSHITFFFLLGLYPVIFYVSNNWFVFETEQLLFLIIVPVITGIVGISLTMFIKLVSDRILHRSLDNNIEYVFFSISGFTLIFILLYSVVNSSKLIFLGFILLALLFTSIIRRVGFNFLNLIIFLMIIFSSITLVQGLSTKSAIYSSLIETTNKQRDASIKFKSTPNIYLIHLESYQSPTAMEKLYDFDNKEFINELSKNDFFVARNNFSNYYDTLTSVGAMFLQQHHYYKVSKGIFDSIGIRDMIGGRTYNPTLAILKNNGYEINFIHSHVYTFMGNDYLDYYHPSNSLHDSLLILQSPIIDAARKSLFKINTLSKRKMNMSEDELVEKILWDKLEESNATDQPSFYYINHWGAIHTPPNGAYTWKDNREERWMNYYTETVKSVNNDLLKMTNKIISMDPEGIIILYGDHGSMLYRDVWTDNKHNVDINDLIYQRKMLSTENLSLDIFGTFLAVRYPNGNPNFQDGETLVNLFRNLFSTLAENDVLLEYKPENNSYLYDDNKLYLMIEDGVPLERIVTLEK